MDDLTKIIMKKVVRLEKKRVTVWILSLIVIILSLVIIGGVVLREIGDSGVQDLVAVVGEDFKVVGIIWQEIPKEKLFVFSVFLVAVGMMWKGWPVIRQKVEYLTKLK